MKLVTPTMQREGYRLEGIVPWSGRRVPLSLAPKPREADPPEGDDDHCPGCEDCPWVVVSACMEVSRKATIFVVFRPDRLDGADQHGILYKLHRWGYKDVSVECDWWQPAGPGYDPD